MHRQNLLSKLKTYKKNYPNEISTTEAFQTFIERYPSCFERSLEIGHLTGSCWLWNVDQSAALFTLHKKLGMWLQLGGHADGDTNILRVALKEAQEESGINQIEALSEEILDLSIHEIPPYKETPAHLHYDVRFILRVSENLPLKISSESNDLKWITPEDFSKFDFDPSILRMHRKVKSLILS